MAHLFVLSARLAPARSYPAEPGNALDCDRATAIVSEISDRGARRRIGVARRIAKADHRKAAFAILIEDAWQGRGLGTKLTNYWLEIGRNWNVNR